MRRAALAAVLALAPLPAAALSCLPFEPFDAFLAADESPARFVVVLGEVTLPGPKPGGRQAFRARVTGLSLTQEGFTRPFEAEVTVQPHCTGGFCTTLGTGRHMLFLEQRALGYRLDMQPCRPFAFPDPRPLDISEVTACFRGEGCGML